MTRVLVTRPAKQAEPLCALLEQNNIQAVRFPLLDIKPLPITNEQLMIFEELPKIDWVIFVSANAVQNALTVLDGKILGYCQNTRIAAIGQATAKALQNLGLTVTVIPKQGFTSEALLAMPEFQNIKGLRFVNVRGVGGREVLVDTLRARGAQVHYLEVYRRITTDSDPKTLVSLLENSALDMLTIYSGEALFILMEKLEQDKYRQLLKAIPLIVISDRLRLQALATGFKQVCVSEDPSDLAVFKKVISLVSGECSG